MDHLAQSAQLLGVERKKSHQRIDRQHACTKRCIVTVSLALLTLTDWTDIIRNTNHTNGNVIDILLNIFRELLSDVWLSRETIQCLINRLSILNDITVVDGINEVRILTEHRRDRKLIDISIAVFGTAINTQSFDHTFVQTINPLVSRVEVFTKSWDLKDNLDQVNDLCEERERIINECNQKIIDYEAIIKDLKKANEYYIRKENCATPVKECDDYDSSYPPTKVK